MDVPIKGDLPGLYHPRVQNQNAWMEVSAGALLQPTEGFAKRWMAKSAFKSNMAGLIFSLVGQHYYLTLKHSVKKQNLEPQIRQYAEKNLRSWSEEQNKDSIRAKIFKPIRPLVERWAKWLNKKAAQQQKKA
jgi:translation initiation factor RLI1